MFKVVAVFLMVLKGEVLMSFGTEMGGLLTSSDEFKADLITTVSINFDAFELIYIKDFQLFIRLGLKDNPGSNNEMIIEAGELELASGMTYPIGPKPLSIQASFGLAGYLEYLPQTYWGHLNIKSLVTDDAGKTMINASILIGWESDDGNEMEVRCSTLKIST